MVKLSTVDDVFAQTQRMKPKRIVDLAIEEEKVVSEEKKPTMDESKAIEPDTVEGFLGDVPEQFTGKPKLTATNDSDDVGQQNYQNNNDDVVDGERSDL